MTTRTLQVLRRRPTEQYGAHQHENEFNVQPQGIPPWLQDWLDNRGGYLIGNMRTRRPDFRFFSLGNTLACLFGLLSPPQQRALFRLVLHNGGHWPCLFWSLAWAVVLHQQRHRQADRVLMAAMQELLEEGYALQRLQLPRQQWAEYFDGPTGTWVGQQSRTFQTWTVVGFLLLHQVMRLDASAVQLIDLDSQPGGGR